MTFILVWLCLVALTMFQFLVISLAGDTELPKLRTIFLVTLGQTAIFMLANQILR